MVWVLHSVQYRWNSTFNIKILCNFSRVDFVTPLYGTWAVSVPPMEMKVSIKLQAHYSTTGKCMKNFSTTEKSGKLYKKSTSLWKCWVSFLLSMIKPQVIRLGLVLYSKGKISLTRSMGLLNQIESNSLVVYTSLFHRRNEHHIFHNPLHF